MQGNKAYIIGDLNKAVFFEKDEAFVISGESNSHSYPLTGYEWSQICSLRSEYYYSDYSSIPHLKEITNKIYQKSEALEMALELMDTNLSGEYRSGIAKILATNLDKEEEFFVYVKNRLLSTPTPDCFDPDQAYSFVLPYSEKTANLYNNLRDKTKAFAAYYTILKIGLNLELEKQDFVDQTLTDLGYYSKFSEALYESSKNKYDSAAVLTLIKLQELHISHSPSVFFEIESKLKQDYKIVLTEAIKESQQSKGKEQTITKFDEDEIIQLIEAHFSQKQSEHDNKLSKRGKAKKITKYSENNLDTVEILKEWSKKYASKNDDAFLHEFKDVIKNQLRTSRPEHISKTCCDLASHFTQINRFTLSKKLLSYAKRLTPEDIVVYTQEAELSNRIGDLPKALELYNLVLKNFSDNVVSYSGKAKTLRDIGKFQEALQQYDETIKRFNEDVVFRGKAETLRDMGRFQEALELYDETIKKFGENIISFCGKAETLRDMGKFQEALKLYDETIKKIGDDVFAYCGKAETLRDMGKFSEALKQYDETIIKFGDSYVAFHGKAETLRDIGKYSEALKQYEKTIKKFDGDIFANCGKAETLRDMGKFSEALSLYDETIKKFSHDVVAYCGKAETLRDMGKLPEALNLYDETIKKFSQKVVAYNAKAETLRDMGKLPEALNLYDETIKKFRYNVVAYNGKAETLRDMGKLSEALKQYDETIKKFSHNVVAYNGKAETLRDMGKLSEALDQYEMILQQNFENKFAQNGRLKLLLETGKLENYDNILIKEDYKTFDDYISLHIYSTFLIKKGDWNEASKMIEIGLKSPFLKDKPHFRSLASYLKILQKQYTAALKYFNPNESNKPVESLLATHAFAASNQINQAKAILHKLDYIERPVIRTTLNYLSERYLLNGFQKSGKPTEELDTLIIEGEMKALLQY